MKRRAAVEPIIGHMKGARRAGEGFTARSERARSEVRLLRARDRRYRGINAAVVLGANGFKKRLRQRGMVGLPRRPGHVESAWIVDRNGHIQSLSAFGPSESFHEVQTLRR